MIGLRVWVSEFPAVEIHFGRPADADALADLHRLREAEKVESETFYPSPHALSLSLFYPGVEEPNKAIELGKKVEMVLRSHGFKDLSFLLVYAEPDIAKVVHSLVFTAEFNSNGGN